MSKYTMELREIVSTFGRDEVKNWFMDYELSDFLTADEVTVITNANVWSKEKLAERIIDHFFTREIGTDAIGQFILFAKDKMNEIMETYASIIYTTSLKYNPLNNVDYTETYTGETSGSSNTSTTSTDNGLRISSDTPQGQINKEAILQGEYATSTDANEGESRGEGESSNKGEQEYTRKISGNNGENYQKLVREYRNNIRAINTEIVYALEPLFMGLY